MALDNIVIIKEELIAKLLHPDRLERLCTDYCIDFLDYLNVINFLY